VNRSQYCPEGFASILDISKHSLDLHAPPSPLRGMMLLRGRCTRALGVGKMVHMVMHPGLPVGE